MALWREFNNIDVRDYKALHPELFAFVKEQMARPEKQFLFIGDTNHLHPVIQNFANGPALAALCKYAGITDVCIEQAREVLPPHEMESYRQALAANRTGEIPGARIWGKEQAFQLRSLISMLKTIHDRVPGPPLVKLSAAAALTLFTPGTVALALAFGTFLDRMIFSGRTFGFSHAGLRVTGADAHQWGVCNTHERMFLGDREVADYIRREVGDNKTAVIYGIGHLEYNDGLQGNLNPEKSVYIPVYRSFSAYKKNRAFFKQSPEILPDRIYLLNEHKLIKPVPDDYAYNNIDHHRKERAKISERFGMSADPETKAAAIAKIKKSPEIDPDYFNYKPPLQMQSLN